ncbi:hypothetical protein POM88_016665 [Heracleum sosnowskyi]|uniref:Uncharacterized protein n=1 Tax=Heracleum sosnowskyi TaxID=360622 RepID=A0AAD8MXM3_9APIA|nr:hypothetical protein POM88_016665 [Heracleum sosnowskyi]
MPETTLTMRFHDTMFGMTQTMYGQSAKKEIKLYGFLDDDNECHEVIEECSKCGFPTQIKELFVHIMVNCQVTDLLSLWKKHWKNMSDDIIMRRRKENVNANITIIDKQLEFYVLAKIDKLLKCIGKSLKHYEYEEDDIVIPADFCDPDTTNSVDTMIEWTYPNFMEN